MRNLTDIGANLAHESFAHDLSAVLNRAAAAGVARMIVTGTTVEVSGAAARLAEAHPGLLWATAGIHPHHAAGFGPDARSRLADLLQADRVVAAGECGLDHFRNHASPADQRRAFTGQLSLAADAGRPVFLHQREAHAEFLQILREFRSGLCGGVAHCFTGGPGELEDCLALDLYVGVTGWICDERRSAALREAVVRLPLDRLLVETDAPYLLPRTLRPRPATRRNEPAWLPEVVRVLSACMGRSPEEIAAASTANAQRLFGLQ